MEPKLKNAERTEEVQQIIERMPVGVSVKITAFVILIVVVFFLLGWIIKYPDVVPGMIKINASSPPVKLIANTSGKLKLNGYKNYSHVKEGAYIAVLQNEANLDDFKAISDLLSKTQIKDVVNSGKNSQFPKDISLGEINVFYFKFLSALNESTNYQESNLYDKQKEVLSKLIEEYRERLKISTEQKKMSVENLKYVDKFHKRDSILFSKKVLSESENDRSEIQLISAKDSHQSMLRDISNVRSQLKQTENELQQVLLQKGEKEKQLELALISSYTDLTDHLKSWEQKYILKAPMDGKIQFLKFWSDNQFVQAGEPVFTIIPIQRNIIGQMTMPASGAGKVKAGQEVIIKLADYPYQEYGSVKGIVSDVSLTSSEVNSKDGMIETYLINVSLPNALKTNYGKDLKFKFEIKGSADIITNKRKLIERLFDNLSYKLNE